MSSYPFFIPEFVLCANSSLFSFKIANEPSEFRNYLLQSNINGGILQVPICSHPVLQNLLHWQLVS